MTVEFAIEPLLALLSPFVLVLGRVTGLTLALPILVTEMAPMGLRVGIILALTCIMFPVAPVAPEAHLALSVAGELLLGVALGLVVRIALAAAELGAEVAGTQLGFGFSQTADPLSQQNVGPLTRLVTMVGAALLFATEGYHTILRALAASFVEIPSSLLVGSGGWSWWTQRMLDASAQMFVVGLRIALPLIGVGLATQITFGLLTKVAPQLNLWGLGFLVSMGAGLVGLSVFAPTIVSELRELVTAGLHLDGGQP